MESGEGVAVVEEAADERRAGMVAFGAFVVGITIWLASQVLRSELGQSVGSGLLSWGFALMVLLAISSGKAWLADPEASEIRTIALALRRLWIFALALLALGLVQIWHGSAGLATVGSAMLVSCAVMCSLGRKGRRDASLVSHSRSLPVLLSSGLVIPWFAFWAATDPQSSNIGEATSIVPFVLALLVAATCGWVYSRSLRASSFARWVVVVVLLLWGSDLASSAEQGVSISGSMRFHGLLAVASGLVIGWAIFSRLARPDGARVSAMVLGPALFALLSFGLTVGRVPTRLLFVVARSSVEEAIRHRGVGEQVQMDGFHSEESTSDVCSGLHFRRGSLHLLRCDTNPQRSERLSHLEHLGGHWWLYG